MDARATEIREYERAKMRQEREERLVLQEIRHQRHLPEKADEPTQAALEVREYHAQLAVLRTLHREAGERWDWQTLAATLPPPPPLPVKRLEQRVLQDLTIALPEQQQQAEPMLDEARKGDRLETEAALKAFAQDRTEGQRLAALARRILVGDTAAYQDAITELRPLAELEDLGAAIDFILHSAVFVECALHVSEASTIPPEIKAVSSGSKLIKEAMPRSQSHDLYQDFLCSSVLRIARELFALLPLEDVLVTVHTRVEHTAESASIQPVLSVVLTRTALEALDFARLNPAEALGAMVHCGEVKATRGGGAFRAILPIQYEHVALPPSVPDLDELVRRTVTLRHELKERFSQLQEAPTS